MCLTSLFIKFTIHHRLPCHYSESTIKMLIILAWYLIRDFHQIIVFNLVIKMITKEGFSLVLSSLIWIQYEAHLENYAIPFSITLHMYILYISTKTCTSNFISHFNFKKRKEFYRKIAIKKYIYAISIKEPLPINYHHYQIPRHSWENHLNLLLWWVKIQKSPPHYYCY